jgi:hypothetical protein
MAANNQPIVHKYALVAEPTPALLRVVLTNVWTYIAVHGLRQVTSHLSNQTIIITPHSRVHDCFKATSIQKTAQKGPKMFFVHGLMVKCQGKEETVVFVFRSGLFRPQRRQ